MLINSDVRNSLYIPKNYTEFDTYDTLKVCLPAYASTTKRVTNPHRRHKCTRA